MAYSMKGKSPIDVSREGFTRKANDHSQEELFQYTKIGSLQRIANALESIDAKLACQTTRKAFEAIIRLDKRAAKKEPLR